MAGFLWLEKVGQVELGKTSSACNSSHEFHTMADIQMSCPLWLIFL
jgi:hypothetical protein